MTQGESIISIILIVIAYFLYQIAKQLTYITRKRLKFPFSTWQINKFPKKQPKKDPPENLLN